MLTGILLDAGCGTGDHTILAARHGARGPRIDVSPRAIGPPAVRPPRAVVDTRFVVLDALHLDHPR